MFERGTLVRFHSGSSEYVGFVIGTCSYDNGGPDNAYVVRYVFTGSPPHKPYTIVAADAVEVVADFPENFNVGGHWSATPKDRADEWVLKRESGRILVVPNA
jgi:hypothetical protein